MIEIFGAVLGKALVAEWLHRRWERAQKQDPQATPREIYRRVELPLLIVSLIIMVAAVVFSVVVLRAMSLRQ